MQDKSCSRLKILKPYLENVLARYELFLAHCGKFKNTLQCNLFEAGMIMYQCGYCMEHGILVPKNLKEARVCYAQASCMRSRMGTRAFKSISKALAQEDLFSDLEDLLSSYLIEGLSPDTAKFLLKEIKCLAVQGNSTAQYCLSLHYRRPDNPEYNLYRSMWWLQTAADAGNPLAKKRWERIDDWNLGYLL